MKSKIERIIHVCLIIVILNLFCCAFPIEKSEKLSNTTIIEIFKKDIKNPKIIYTIIPQGVVISIESSLLFYNNENLSENSKFILDELGKIIYDLDLECLIEGNVKNLSYDKNKYNSNIEYSMILAEKILNYLLKYSRINPNNIKAIGFGEFSPFFTAQNNHKMDNRIDFVLLNY
jgi:flagellar motor protein MotB